MPLIDLSSNLSLDPSNLAAWADSSWIVDAWPLGLQSAGFTTIPVLILGCSLLTLATILIVYVHWLRRRNAQLSAHLRGLVTERRHAERARRETEVFYHSLVETLPQMILRKDLDGAFTFANQRFCNELGRSFEEIVGKTDHDFFRRDLADKYRQDDRRVIDSGETFEAIEEHVTPQGETLYVQIIKTPIKSDDGKPIGIQGIFWDVTERKRAEERLKEQNLKLQEMARSEHEAHDALKAAQSRLVEQEKLASLGHLVAGVAHEINNPLAFVSNNIAVLDRDLHDLIELITLFREIESRTDSRLKEDHERLEEISERIDLDYTIENLPRLIERTREGLRRIERIVKDLRLFARVDEGEWNEVDLNPGIESSANMVKGYAKKNEVSVRLDLGALPLVLCRGAKIHQVVVNLLTNAIDACGKGGEVTVRTSTEPEAFGVRIEVIDTGCGIPPEIRERIFDPFFTTKPLGQGTGLGLSISYGIVREHGGRIEVQSESGKGTHFTIHLPVNPERPSKQKSSSTTTPKPTG